MLNWTGASVSRLLSTQRDSDLLTLTQDFAHEQLAQCRVGDYSKWKLAMLLV